MTGRKRHEDYVCCAYHTKGKAACDFNTIGEAALLAVLIDLLQRRFLSPAARPELRDELVRQSQRQQQPAPVADAARLRRQIADLTSKIDKGAERLLSVPDSLVATVTAKLDAMRIERDELQARLNAQQTRQSDRNANDAQEVNHALAALETLTKATPEELQELVRSFVAKIVLHYAPPSEKRNRKTHRFTHGEIQLRPDAAFAGMFQLVQRPQRRAPD